MRRVLVSRLDSMGDVLLAGPAVRAVARSGEVTMLVGPAGADAALLLPGVADVMVWDSPWVGFAPPAVDADRVARLVADVESRRFDAAAVLTSFHQSPLVLAMLLRLAGVAEIAAVSVDYPGSLLDHRLAYEEHLHEVEQNLAVVAALGFRLEDGDDRLALAAGRLPPSARRGHVVVHPGASVPARALPGPLASDVVRMLAGRGRAVVVTGRIEDTGPLERVDVQPATDAGGAVVDLRGQTTLAELAAVVAAADAVVVGNTGPAHLAAATGTPVVSVFAPVVSPRRWSPWKVPHVQLGRLDIGCRGCRARTCPLATQWCVSGITAGEVVAAVDALSA